MNRSKTRSSVELIIKLTCLFVLIFVSYFLFSYAESNWITYILLNPLMVLGFLALLSIYERKTIDSQRLKERALLTNAHEGELCCFFKHHRPFVEPPQGKKDAA